MRLGIFLALAALVAGLPSAASHPTLVKADTAMCSTCHDDLLAGRGSQHPPVIDDCTGCHEVEKTEAGTTITLMAAEPELCLMCHDDKEAAYSGDLASPHAAVMDSCLSCHQVHSSEHAGLLVENETEVCTSCHDTESLAAPHSDRLPEKADCLGCHLPHGGPNEHLFTGSNLHAPFADGSCDGCHRKPFGERVRLRNRGERLCTACHGTFDMPENGSTHASLKGEGGRAGCLNCHDPHMSDQPGFLITAGTDLCAACHQDTHDLATADTGHPPAAEDCLGCHVPHVAEQNRLLHTPARELCTACHDVDDSDLKASHLQADLTSLNCVSCHDPHGSPAGNLLARNLHPPLLEGCDSCHEGAFNELAEDGESTLCLMCHDDVGEQAEAATVPHAALEMSRCVDCHNPHASPNDRLVAAAGGGVCTTCHDDKLPEEGEQAHGVIDLLGCQSCHLPHGGENQAMLRVEGNLLCRSCHDRTVNQLKDSDEQLTVLDRFTLPASTAREMVSIQLTEDGRRGHPDRKHPVSGKPEGIIIRGKPLSIFQGELSCLSCHDPHKGTGNRLFRNGRESSSQLCTECHAGR